VPDSPEILKTDVLVIGAGVLGLCTAVELTRRGHDVRIVDPGEPNASAVAAGMIAPAMEAVLDGVTPLRAVLFRAGREAWDGFAADAGIEINRARTIWAGEDPSGIRESLRLLGFDTIEPEPGERLVLPSEALVEPGPALAAMHRALGYPVIAGRADRIERIPGGWRVETSNRTLMAKAVVLATGAATAVEGLADGVTALVELVVPIRGQIGVAAAVSSEAVMRGRGIYVAPSGDGVVIGATMGAGRRDLEPDAADGRALLSAGQALWGRRIEGPVEWRVGIRGATPDGLPMAGASGEPDLYLALAPRRNGWLLGPLVAKVVADAVRGIQDGSARSPHADALDPLRFANR
jgi:glycine oxidase